MGIIHVLSRETSRLIAAGEVIDRPASALRELLDNALDAGASDISVLTEKGGIDLLRVIDNGSGMDRDDLALSIQEHATSKILKADDLLSVRTMGFRGEALASIAAVARLEITSCEKNSEIGWKLQSEPGKPPVLTPVAARQGTVVTVQGIFEQYPARRQFLKKPSAEALLCRQVFTERALAHPHIQFSWSSGAETSRYPAGSLLQRMSLLYPELPAHLLSEVEIKFETAAFHLILAEPSFHRNDRRYLQVFVNRRKVPEWGLMSVVEYAYSEYLPGGMKPCAFLFADIEPSLADFNIHPAKREVRIKTIESLKSLLYSSLKEQLHTLYGSGSMNMAEYSPAAGLAFETVPPSQKLDQSFWETVRTLNETPIKESDSSAFGTAGYAGERPTFRYIGRAFGPYLLFSIDDTLFILDQHAAHERILYDSLLERPVSSQALLVPYIFEPESDDMKNRLASILPEMKNFGFEIEKQHDAFIIHAVPALLGEKAIPAFLDFVQKPPENSRVSGIVATMACRAAIKDGDVLDDFSARELIAKSLQLPFPRCPHGRPIWIRLDRDYLDKMSGRNPG